MAVHTADLPVLRMGDPQQPDRHDARGLQTHHEPFRLENSMDTGRLLSARLRLLRNSRSDVYQTLHL